MDMFRRMTFGFLGMAAVAASLLLIRSQRDDEEVAFVPPGETVPGEIQLERLRELGI
jgi:hypothetical protein